MKNLFLLLLISCPLNLFSQVNITPYVSSGYISHLGRKGLNSEIGLEAEFFKRLDLSIHYRYARAARSIGNDVTISGISSNISYIFINRLNHRLMIGAGLTSGHYERYTDYLGPDNHYEGIWFDPVRIRYDFTILNRIRAGAIIALTGEDGDGSVYSGVLLGFKF